MFRVTQTAHKKELKHKSMYGKKPGWWVDNIYMYHYKQVYQRNLEKEKDRDVSDQTFCQI